MGNAVKIERISVGGLSFKCRTCGLENNGELVVFLHGFPESSIIWVNVMKKLAAIGYRCIAPDQRGYSEGARPEGILSYSTHNLSTDVVALADSVGNIGKFHLVGHDWGATIGWATVAFYTDRIQSWTALAVPHSKAFREAMMNDPVQRSKSSYILEFLKPDIPEASLAADDYKRLKTLWTGFPQEVIDDYMTIFSVPEARTGAINYYRASLTPPSEENPAVPLDEVFTPTLFIWGMNDLAIAKAGVDDGHKYIKGEYKYVQLDASHWLMQFNEEECTKEIIDHIKKFPIE